MVAIIVAVVSLSSGSGTAVSMEPVWWDAGVVASLERVPSKKVAWERALALTPELERPGMSYLITHLPSTDLETLEPESLAKNCSLAHQARRLVPWGRELPEEIFLDAVLPHASVTEPRDSMRAEFLERYLPQVADCTTPGAAACRINEHLFKDYKVTYNTRRLRTDQSSRESIAQGMATCTGLSVMLVEACRAVGVPARLALIASWPGRGGNHTWVEVWDGGWHFLGAAEPDPAGLDHAWFVADASKAVEESPRNAIWAITYRSTGSKVPLVWAPGAEVPGENVTRRYAAGSKSRPQAPRLMVEVLRGGERVVADVWAIDEITGKTVLAGRSFGPSRDINDHLFAVIPAGRPVVVAALADGRLACGSSVVTADAVIRIDLENPKGPGLLKLLRVRFGDDDSAARELGKRLALVPWDPSLRSIAWQAFRESSRHRKLREEFEKRTVSTTERTSPYLWREVGTKPETGWPLVIAMHGGGGTTQAVNDRQWKKMFEQYYRDHPEAGGYIYLALRAPNNEWNGFYDDAICPLVARLIRQFVLFKDVDPDRVHALGASHGGYGAFVIGPKMPDRFAAVHASAAAPTDGETQGENLMDLRFTFMVGEHDTDHGRAERCQRFARLVDGWRSARGGYPGQFEWKPGVGHSVPDRDKLADLLEHRRDAHPSRIVWVQSDDVLTHFYWLEADRPVDGGRIESTIRDNRIKIKAEKQAGLALWLDAPLVDLTRAVTIERGDGKPVSLELRPDLETFCRSLEARADPGLAAPARVELSLPGRSPGAG